MLSKSLFKSVRPILAGLLVVGSVVVAVSCQHDAVVEPKSASAGGANAVRTTTQPVYADTGGTSAGGPATAPAARANGAQYPFTFPPAAGPNDLSDDDRLAGSRSCLDCHSGLTHVNPSGSSDNFSMHDQNRGISCVGCHGGHPDFRVPEAILAVGPHSHEYERYKNRAHVQPTHPELWKKSPKDTELSSANPEVSGAATIIESADFIRFVNPGDLRAADQACGACHKEQVDQVRTSMMRHGALLWEAALYNNGSLNRKAGTYGEFYTADGKPAAAVKNPTPTVAAAERGGLLSILWPLPRWEISQPGNILRVFERGGEFRPVIGEPNPLEQAGQPDVKLSVRGVGTDLRTDPVNIGLQKTRLLDPTLNFMGSNDHPGDYRASGCSACHVVYANDRSPVHSAIYSGYGNLGQSFSNDTTVNPPPYKGAPPVTQPSTQPWPALDPTRERGHPIQHTMVKEMTTSTCIVCHVHPGTNVLNSYLGFMWWDNETDGKLMYPAQQKKIDSDTDHEASTHNPEGSAARGLWSDLYPNDKDHTGHVAGPNFLEKLGGPEFNERLTRTQFADFHGHGWVFRAVFKQDRHGNMLDYAGNVVPPSEADPNGFNRKMKAGVSFTSPEVGAHPPKDVPVHLKDVHIERGMSCVDCHFEQDVHGDGNLYTETRNAVQVQCEDCHGTAEKAANILTYLQKDADGSDNQKRDNSLLNAFSGTAAMVKPAFTSNFASKKDRDKAEKDVRDYNKKVVSTHFALSNDDPPRLVQTSAADPTKTWTVPQVTETTDPKSWWSSGKAKDEKVRVGMTDATRPDAPMIDRATLARYAHTIRTDNKTWGSAPDKNNPKSHPELALAHSSSRMSCYACHSSWNTSCFGCHLPQRANQRVNMKHNEAIITRNYTNYNYQTLRDDVYMLGVDSSARDHKIVPIRSSCAVMVSSQDALRQWIYAQQQTVSAEGYAGTAFTPYFPHTVRSVETKQCTDCHLSKARDNNAVMAQLMLQGTNAVNFIGRYAYVAEGDGGLEGVAVTEHDEPQAVYGSTLHELAYPDNYRNLVNRNRELSEAYDHRGTVLDVQMRGEYLYAACGPDGFIAYDIANIDNKGFSERIITAPVSPLGQRFYVKSKYATSICSPSTLALDPTRKRLPENEEGLITPIGERYPGTKVGINLLYAFLYMTDRDEGLIVIGNPLNTPHEQGGPGVSTLLDGDPDNNFLQRAVTFNPGGVLNGARHMVLYGTLAYVCCDRGVVVVDLNDPLHPQVVSVVGSPEISGARRIACQFRYAFVCDRDGVKVLDITDPRQPRVVRDINTNVVTVPILDARDIYVSRTYGYVAAGHEGVVILDLEKPEEPRRLHYPDDFAHDFNAEAGINDANAVRIGMTNASMFAYVADGRNGLKVLQLTSPEYTPTYLGYSPRPEPHLVAWYRTQGPALSISKGLDRDRAVDESGNQLSVFNRKGSRPFTLEEMQHLYLTPEHRPWYVTDVPDGPAPLTPEAAPAPEAAPPPPAPEAPRRTRLPFGRH